ncbi:UvrD-helicase domain-containing protein [Tessaracoccus defluvii]|uniref:DNA 3'-5' helicase n=1 Tax=Tessaracoccus defluvii TaxID=1285901 RepID=A0A7H0H5N3_9ACTN|nr:UvrD-helicase domain-containing protein [Tessaracoccus defluvii]QNP55849.1 DEAD/DEAH box helicase [Tessaracoccus defluvii]
MPESVIIYPKQDKLLDSSIKQKAYSFLEKLAQDDSAPGLHIEPVNNAADARARTGRVDQQYRALLFKLTTPTSTAYVVHGIYNHDDAYTVAAKVKLTINPINGLPEYSETAAPDPVLTWAEPAAAEPLPAAPQPLIAFSAADLTVSLGIPPTTSEQAVALTSKDALQTFAQTLPEWQGLALLLLADGESISQIQQELEIMNRPMSHEEAATRFVEPEPVSDQELLDSFDHPSAQMGFAKLAGADELRRVITGGDFSAWRVFLHPQQRTWVRGNWKGPYRISGGAGTGKTVVVLHRARRLAVEDPGAPIVVTTFTTNLAAELSRSLERLDPDLRFADALGAPGLHVKGIDALARAVVQSAGADVSEAVATVLGVGRTDIGGRTDTDAAWRQAVLRAGEDLDEKLRKPAFLAAEYEMVILPHRITQLADYLKVARAGRGVRLSRAGRKAVWAVVEAYRGAAREAGTLDFAEAASIAAAHLEATGDRPARHVLVDEGQDFKPCHWQLVRALAPEAPNDIFIAEDAHQRIYGQKLMLSAYGIRTQGRSRGLKLNYRTTAQNLAWAVGVLTGQEVIDSDGEAETMAGYLSARTGPKPEVRSFPTLTAELDFAADLVGSWVGSGDVAPETVAVLVRDRVTRDRVVAGLGERGVEVRALEAGTVKPGYPVALTMHRAKGTEFARVLLFGLSKDSMPMGLKAYDYDDEELSEAQLRERSLLYVAASRARDELVVTYSGTPSSLLPASQ